MKFESKTAITEINILANDHYVGVPYDCTDITADSDGIIKAGTVIPANDSTAVGVLLHDVDKNGNPNGTIVIHGFIDAAKMPETPSADAISALKLIYFANLEANNTEEGNI